MKPPNTNKPAPVDLVSAGHFVVHHLQAGVAPCGIGGPPKVWPRNHGWAAHWKMVNCPGCLEKNPIAPVSAGVIHIRTTLQRKSAYVRAAKPGKLTDWMIRNLDHAAKYLE